MLYGSKVIPRGNQAYEDFLNNSYWSLQQESVSPYCIFKPSAGLEVSILVLISRLTQCPFAVRSGGHAAFAGASNIAGGITVSLEDMNEINLSADKRTAAIGPGNTWYDVYENLAEHGLAVVGGRVSGIGVGGLTLGGTLVHVACDIYADNVSDKEASHSMPTSTVGPVTTLRVSM